MPPGGGEVAVEGDEVGQHQADRPADPGQAVDQDPAALLRLLPDGPGEAGQVGGELLLGGVLQGQPHSPEAGQAGQLLAHVDHEGRLQPGQGSSRQRCGRAQVEIRGDLGDLRKFVELLKN